MIVSKAFCQSMETILSIGDERGAAGPGGEGSAAVPRAPGRACASRRQAVCGLGVKAPADDQVAAVALMHVDRREHAADGRQTAENCGHLSSLSAPIAGLGPAEAPWISGSPAATARHLAKPTDSVANDR